MGLPGAFSSSVLLVSIISLSSVEIMCCCLRGFFLGEAPGIRSPVAGVVSVLAWVVSAGADDILTLESERMDILRHMRRLHFSDQIPNMKTNMALTWQGSVYGLYFLLDFDIRAGGTGSTCSSATGCRLGGGGHSVGH